MQADRNSLRVSARRYRRE